MKIAFSKYHALGNDFIVVESGRTKMQRPQLSRLAKQMCDRRRGVGADGVLYLTKDRGVDCVVDVFNADGSWAEKSGNGLRITAVHLKTNGGKGTAFSIRMGGVPANVKIVKKTTYGYLVKAELGRPDFRAKKVPIKSNSEFVINGAIRVGDIELPVTCLSVGNPHTVVIVDSFDFDWKSLGCEIETHKLFPRSTNVEFVKIVNRKKLKVCDWERGAGATGSSGTGAAASVCAAVMLGLANRECEVQFETGALHVDWNAKTDTIELTGPVQSVTSGSFEFNR